MKEKQAELDARPSRTEQDAHRAQSDAERANAGVADLHTRMSSLDDYDTRYMATVYFATNKHELDEQTKKDLDELVQQALPLKGYTIEVAGFADTTGNAKRNQELSELRAEEVVGYLQQVGRVPLRRYHGAGGARNLTERG